VGFDKTIALCRQPTAAGILPHAHSFPLQVMSGSGALGLLGVAAFLCLFLLSPLKNWSLFDRQLKVISISGLSYFLMQCSIDISVFVNPVTIILSGFLIAAPMVFSGQSENYSH
jgi:O-antigen ligase